MAHPIETARWQQIIDPLQPFLRGCLKVARAEIERDEVVIWFQHDLHLQQVEAHLPEVGGALERALGRRPAVSCRRDFRAGWESIVGDLGPDDQVLLAGGVPELAGKDLSVWFEEEAAWRRAADLKDELGRRLARARIGYSFVPRLRLGAALWAEVVGSVGSVNQPILARSLPEISEGEITVWCGSDGERFLIERFGPWLARRLELRTGQRRAFRCLTAPAPAVAA